MSWKRWKLGLGIGALTGFLTGMIGLSLGMSWRGALLMLSICTGKDMLLFLTNHPVDQVSFDTTSTPKDTK